MLKNPVKVTEELIQWIKTYFDESGIGCSAVIGISGGKDSSVVAALCARALGKERVIGVLMPNGSQKDIADAKELVAHLGIQSMEINIEQAVMTLENSLSRSEQFSKICKSSQLSLDTKINLPSRIRMTTLYAVAQSLPQGGRVANTCNRSEDYVGYSTKYGDSAGDFSPLQNLLVEEVRQIGETLGIPEHLIHKVPSDGLSGCSDEEKLGFSYEDLDHYILTGLCEDEETKKKIEWLHNCNLHKLAPMPAYIINQER
ncbi:MAG: NAD(+) synthase [bacterium]|nr:NAD(+) synthase [bacterium]